MKSQKGITMISLILYIASFVAVTAVVGGITTFFYSNMKVMDTNIGSNSSYNKFNLYLLNECKKSGVSLYAWRDVTLDTGDYARLSNTPNNSFITFLNADGSKNSFIYDKDNNMLYYNSIKLCDNVNDFQIIVNTDTGKNVLKVLINIDGTSFQTKYVVGS
jgi:predicted DNA binding protein